MKYRERRMSLSTHPSSSVQCWFGHELESRGIDAVVYTRYIISILLQDHTDPIDSLTYDLGSLWFTPADVASPYSRKARHRKSDRKKYASTEDRNKSTAIECLRSISDEDSGLETLVDELCARLKDVNTQSDSPLLIETFDSPDENTDTPPPVREQDPFLRYYAAFPSLHGGDTTPSLSPTLKESADIWHRNPLITRAISQSTATSHSIAKPNAKPSCDNVTVTSSRASKRDGPGRVAHQRHDKDRNRAVPVNIPKREWSNPYRWSPKYFRYERPEIDHDNHKKAASSQRTKSMHPPRDGVTRGQQHLHTQQVRPQEGCSRKVDTKRVHKATTPTIIERIQKSLGISSDDTKSTTITLEASPSGIDDKKTTETIEKNTWKRIPLSQRSRNDVSDDTCRVTPPCYEEQASWYTEPVQSLVESVSWNDRLYKRRSHSDTQSPPIDAQNDDAYIFGKPMLIDTIIALDDDDVFTFSDPATSNEPPMTDIDYNSLCLPELNIEDYDLGKTLGMNWIAEKLVDDVLSQAGLLEDAKMFDSDFLTTNFETILESVKNLEAEYQLQTVDNNENVNRNNTDTSGDVVEQSLSEALFYNDSNTCPGGSLPYTSQLSDSIMSLGGRLPDNMSIESADSFPFWTPEGADSVWSDDVLKNQAYLDLLNLSDIYNWGVMDKSAMFDGQSLWDIDHTAPIYKSFDLIASEHTAFNDAIYPKIPHVHSEPNMKLGSYGYGLLDPNDTHKKDAISAYEHLYFSSKTHFCPIHVAEETGSKTCLSYQQPQDLFGGYTPTSTPYQEFRNTLQDTSFVPKFRVQKNSDKFVQTGDSLDADPPLSCTPYKCYDYENCLTDDKLYDKIDYVIAILDDDPVQDVDTERSIPLIDVTVAFDGTTTWDMRSLWVSTDVDCLPLDGADEPLSAANIWGSGYNNDAMFLFGNYDDVSSNDPGYFSEHVDSCEQASVTPEYDATTDASQQAFYGSLFAPLPSDAMYSSDLEQLWLRHDSPHTPQLRPPSVSRKPCTYFMEGKCRRSVCKYSHDLSNITCRYWIEGECFKGQNCLFLHDYVSSEEGMSGEDSSGDGKISTHPKKEDQNLQMKPRRQTPRKFYVFKRNSSHAAATNNSNSKAARKSLPLKPRDNG